MEVSFKFTNGETGAEIVGAINNLFGITGTPAIVAAPAPQQVTAAIDPADAPDVGEASATPGQTHDKTGMPWDKRIHSNAKTITEKGSWRKLKGVDDITFANVTRELQAGPNFKPPQPAAPAAAPVAAVATPPALTMPAMPTPPGLPQMPALTPPPAPAPAAPGPFEQLVSFLVSHTNSPSNPTGKLTEDYISQSLAFWGHKDAEGVGRLQLLASATPETIAQVRGAFAQALGLPAGS